MERLGNVHEVDKRCLLGAAPDHLWGSHDEALSMPGGHFRILLLDDGENSLEKLIVSVVTVASSPRVTRTG